MNGARLQLPTDNGLYRVVTSDPGMDQQPRRIDFQIFAVHTERCAVVFDTDTRPFAAWSNVTLPLCDAIQPVLTPPLWHLLGIGKRLEHAFRRRGDEDFPNY